MRKIKLITLPIVFYILGVCAEENDRAGVLFGVSLLPEMSYSVVSTSIEGSKGTFAKMFVALGADMQLGISKNGSNIHLIHIAFSRDFPSEIFMRSITSGYSFVHYAKSSVPSPGIGFEINNYFRLNGFNETPLFPAVQLGLKAGYEIKKHITCWIGYMLGFEQYQYTLDKTTIDRNDLSNTIRELGQVRVNEFILANRLQLSLSYLIY
jgi:hypothetical protein